jgi:hypothetical protein
MANDIERPVQGEPEVEETPGDLVRTAAHAGSVVGGKGACATSPLIKR